MKHRGMKDAWFGEIFHFRESVDENFRDLSINNPVTTLRLKFAQVAAGAAGFAEQICSVCLYLHQGLCGEQLYLCTCIYQGSV
jgi:hypothetical protein